MSTGIAILFLSFAAIYCSTAIVVDMYASLKRACSVSVLHRQALPVRSDSAVLSSGLLYYVSRCSMADNSATGTKGSLNINITAASGEVTRAVAAAGSLLLMRPILASPCRWLFNCSPVSSWLITVNYLLLLVVYIAAAVVVVVVAAAAFIENGTCRISSTCRTSPLAMASCRCRLFWTLHQR